MKATLLLKITTCLLLALTLFSCDSLNGDSDDNDPYYDDKTQTIGKYGGVLIGSSGFYVITFKPLGSEALLNFDGTEYKLTTNVEIKPEKPIESMVLSDGTRSIVISLEDFFSIPELTIQIPGHEIIFTSDNLLEENSIGLYVGSSASKSGNSYINMDYNLSLNHVIKTFKIIQKITGSSNPNQIGEKETIEGTFSIQDGKITFSGDFGTLTLNYSPTGISYTEVGENDYFFDIDLNKVY